MSPAFGDVGDKDDRQLGISGADAPIPGCPIHRVFLQRVRARTVGNFNGEAFSTTSAVFPTATLPLQLR